MTRTGDRSPRARTLYVVAVALTFGNPLLHKAVSDVADGFSARWGFARYDLVSLVAIPLVSLAVALPAVLRNRRFLTRPLTMGLLAALLALSAAAQRWLLVVNVELVHLPQFGLIAAILLFAGQSGISAFLLATLAGVLDESYQHLVIYAETPGTYFDINDLVLNAIGSAWAAVLFAWLSRARPDASAPVRWTARRWAFSAVAATAAFAAAWWWDPPVFDPLLRTSPAHPWYRVLSLPEGLVACSLLAAIVQLAWKNRFTNATGVPTKRSAAVSSLASLLMLFTGACATATPRVTTTAPQRPNPAGAADFVTTFWCGPPLDEFDDRRAQEIAMAGFTVVGSPCEGAITPDRNRRALDIAAKYGLKMWIADERYNERALRQPGWEAALDAAVQDYRDHPALGGYFVTDEPSGEQFDDLRMIVERLRLADASHFAYINLNPEYAFRNAADVYPIYLEQFVDVVRPTLLSFDYYPFLVAADRPAFFHNLALFRDAGERHRLPFLLILLAMPHGPYREVSEAELSWQAFHALAYGARGVSYFAYWTPVDVPYADVMKFRRGLIEEGQPTAHYWDASRLNHQVRALAAQLDTARLRDVRDSRGEIAPSLPFGPIAAITGGAVTVGFFEDSQRRMLTLLVNRDYRSHTRVTVRPASTGQRADRFDLAARRWTPTAGRSIDLAPGAAILLRWR